MKKSNIMRAHDKKNPMSNPSSLLGSKSFAIIHTLLWIAWLTAHFTPDLSTAAHIDASWGGKAPAGFSAESCRVPSNRLHSPLYCLWMLPQEKTPNGWHSWGSSHNPSATDTSLLLQPERKQRRALFRVRSMPSFVKEAKWGRAREAEGNKLYCRQWRFPKAHSISFLKERRKRVKIETSKQ